DKYRATRIRVGGEKLLTPLFLYQNYHLVHHLHPSVPFYRYIRAWRRNEQAYLDRNAAISTWFGRSMTASEYTTWRRLTDRMDARSTGGESQRRQYHSLRVGSIEQLTDESVEVTFEVPNDLAQEYRYMQGQHVTVRAIVDGCEVARSYSITAAVSTCLLKIAVKKIPGGLMSTYINDELQPGDILDVMPPAGNFHTPLDSTRARSYVAVVAGSGITPVLSIIATTRLAEPDSRFTLIYGNRTTQSAMFREQLDEWADERLAVHHVLSREAGAEFRGRITPAVVDQFAPDTADVDAWFLCGPSAMVDSVKTALTGISVPGRILTEVFHADRTQVDIDVDSTVTVSLDGIETSFELCSSGATVLDAALQQGVEPPYSCAGGACGTCRAKVLLGRAVMDQNHVLTEDEIEHGYVLTCQAHPVSEELKLDYNR
ncbi:2Fe-2S iron-sulfur cluster-binding protein, partial [Mycobacterium sp. D16R24]|uniref:2Fe-2S iron-sulfur cluster-binding protein n=1 Tax=Mycobacterium sp. D16R24 TaxID=1855656 RepID=UPI00111668E3